MNEESDVIHIYRTALYAAIGLIAIFERESSLMSLMVLLMIGLILIVNMM